MLTKICCDPWESAGNAGFVLAFPCGIQKDARAGRADIVTSRAWRANGKISPAMSFHRYRRAASRFRRHGTHLPLSSTSPAATAAAATAATASASAVDVALLDGMEVGEEKEVVVLISTRNGAVAAPASSNGDGEGEDGFRSGGCLVTVLLLAIDMRPNSKEPRSSHGSRTSPSVVASISGTAWLWIGHKGRCAEEDPWVNTAAAAAVAAAEAAAAGPEAGGQGATEGVVSRGPFFLFRVKTRILLGVYWFS